MTPDPNSIVTALIIWAHSKGLLEPNTTTEDCLTMGLEILREFRETLPEAASPDLVGFIMALEEWLLQ